jgi:hypothetical protein
LNFLAFLVVAFIMASGAKKENFNPIDVFLVATIGAGFILPNIREKIL